MQNAHRTTAPTPGLTSDFGRGPALAFGFAGTLALGWLIAMIWVIASWVTGA